MALVVLLAAPANAFRDGVESTIFGNPDQVLGCSPSPCHRPLTSATTIFPDPPVMVALGDVVDLTLQIGGGPGVSCGFTADTSDGEFTTAQPDPLVRHFTGGSPMGLTHSFPRAFAGSVCEFVLRWEATTVGTSQIAVNTISANGDVTRFGDGGAFEQIAISVAPRVYEITPVDIGSGFSIDSGSIGTVDTAPDDGLLDPSEIVSFHVTYTHPSGQDTLTDAGSTVLITGNIAISATQILVPDESPADHFNQIVIDDDSSFAFLRWRTLADTMSDLQAITAQEPAGLVVDTASLPPGSIEVASVPEPASSVLRAGSLLCLVWLVRRRRTEQQPRCRSLPAR